MPAKPLNLFTARADIAGNGTFPIILLRGFSLVFMTLLALFGPQLLNIALPTLPLLSVALVLLIWSLLLHGLKWLLHWQPPLLMELAIDILAWSLFIGLSGGATNPLISILLPLVAIGAAVLSPQQAWLLGGLSILAYSLLWQFYLPLVVLDPAWAVYLHLLGMWMTFVVSVAVAVWFISRMTAAVRERDRALAVAREEGLRNDWVVSLGNLAAGAAHELSTPLSTLATLVEEMQGQAGLPEGFQEDLQLMQRQIGACKHSLTLLTARAGHLRAEHPAACSLAEWLRGLLGSWQALHPSANISLSISPQIEALRVMPELSLEQALRNLVDNAIAADPQSIQVALSQEGDELTMRISDLGGGIPSGVMTRLQELPPMPSAQGLGIGLALSKGTIERFAGSLRFKLRAEGGTDTLVQLPLSRLAVP